MPALSIQVNDDHQPDRLHAAVRVLCEDGLCFTASSTFPNPWTAQHAEKLEWLRNMLPEMARATRRRDAGTGLQVGRQLMAAGIEIFRRLFCDDPLAIAAWNEVKDQLHLTDIEILSVASVPIPWEIVRDPATGKVLSESARAFRVMEALPPQSV